MLVEEADLPLHELDRQLDVCVRAPEVSVPFRDFVLEHQVVAEGVPGQFAEEPVILVQVVPRVRQHEVGVELGLERLEQVLDLAADVRKEPVAEAVDRHRAVGPGEERGGARPRLVGPRSRRGEDDPRDADAWVGAHKREDRPAASDLDVVGVRAEHEDLAQRARAGR